MKFEKRDGVTILGTDERLDVVNWPDLKDLIEQLALECGVSLVIDMEKTILIDSSGCGALMGLKKTLMKNYGDMKIARPTPGVLKVFHVTGLDRIFEIHDSVENAVRSFD